MNDFNDIVKLFLLFILTIVFIQIIFFIQIILFYSLFILYNPKHIIFNFFFSIYFINFHI